jgi:ABC-type polysaccharide/polyol phosphate transport system ATPase subunit
MERIAPADRRARPAATAVSVDRLAKTFRISTDPIRSLKERVLRLGRGGHVDFQALQTVTFDIEQGETVGILGHNGSGKSTLLKCIAGILTPTSGEVRVRGRLASLLELGAGFHPELTGRENVYINAAFYGLGRRAVDRVFDDIVEFAELAQFIDEPVKHYSSGMYVRLGFAVAVHLDPEVLLVDEVLAVGDELFQAKCLSRIQRFQDDGRTIVFVTHDAPTVRQVCSRAIVLDRGEIVLDGSPGDAVRSLREHLHGSFDERSPVADGHGVIGAVAVRHRYEQERRFVRPGEPVDLEIDLVPVEPVERPVLGIEIADRRGNLLFRTDSDALGVTLRRLAEPRRVRVHIGRTWLLDGEFPISVKLTDRATGTVVDWRDDIASFEIASAERADGTVSLDVTVEDAAVVDRSGNAAAG